MESNPSQTEEHYRAAVGESKGTYYLPLFYRFDQPGSSRVSWNWPAFFVTFFWMVYRRMYGLAFAYLLLWPLALGVLIGVISVLFGAAAAAFTYWAGLLAQLILVPMFANAAYHWHVRKRIEKMSAGAPSHEATVQRLIGESSGGSPVAIAIASVGIIAILGILAAIAIPAYQDYTIRAQVTEGLNLAAKVKASVAESYAASGNWPDALTIARLDVEQYTGQYVSGIEISHGVVLIHYGNGANRIISGQTLSLHPAPLESGGIEWSCGYAAGDDTTRTDIAPKYLPRSCRDAAPQVERL